MNVFIGVDVSLASSAVCILGEGGKIIKEAKIDSEPEAFVSFMQGLPHEIPGIGLEAGPLSQWLYKVLTDAGLPTVLMETRRVKKALEAMPLKTDRRDAEGIAHLLQLGWYSAVHCKSVTAQETRAVLTARDALKKAIISMELSVRGILRNFGLKMGRIPKQRYNERVRELIDGIPMLEAMALPVLRARADLRKELAGLEKLVRNMARRDPVCCKLMTMPGVGPVIALTYRAAVDDPIRFRRSKDIGPWVGLTPKRDESGERSVTGPISKTGDAGLRCALYQAANAMLNCGSENWLKTWTQQLAEKCGNRKKAKVALARRIGVVLHRMWVDGTDFQTTRDEALALRAA
ncbi:IS110 family transposase [Leisingera sp.]|uniref:IS110 family transposase n=1 Tax=Leisingera sp. TaxID=1879318 RepID=UPI002B267A69|nr:IS110 family transposase [Leisingera sp.]